jgi:hypothetical protein
LPLQRLWKRLSVAVTSPTRHDRLEVAFTFRVLSTYEVSKTLGSSTPAQPWCWLAPDSPGFPFASRARGRDSPNDPLLAFSAPSRFDPTTSPCAFRHRAPLLGFLAPSAHIGEGSPRPHEVSLMLAPWVLPRRLRTVPTPFDTVPLAGFLNLSAAFSSPHRPAMFQTGSTRGVNPSGDSSSLTEPDCSSQPSYPLAVLPWLAHPPFLGGGNQGRPERFLGCRVRCLSRLQGLPLSKNRSASPKRFKVSTTDQPLLGFCLLMVCTPASVSEFPRSDRHRFTTLNSVARVCVSLRFTVSRSQ